MSQRDENSPRVDTIAEIETKEHDVGVSSSTGEVLKGRDRGGDELDFGAFADIGNNNDTTSTEDAANESGAEKPTSDKPATTEETRQPSVEEKKQEVVPKPSVLPTATTTTTTDDTNATSAVATASASEKQVVDSSSSKKVEEEKPEEQATAAAAATTKKSPKPPKPVVEIHPNGRDLLMASPTFLALWVGEQHVVVGGGGGGKKFELPNSLALVHVPTANWTGQAGFKKPPPASLSAVAAAIGGDMNCVSTGLCSVIHALDFEEAGTLQSVTNQCAVTSQTTSKQGATTTVSHFVVTHNDAFSLVRYEEERNNPSSSSSSSVMFLNNKIKTICRVALVTDPINSDTKIATLVTTPPQKRGDTNNEHLIFVAQDNCTVAVYRLSTLVSWAKREGSILKSGDGGDNNDSSSSSAVVVAKTIDEIRSQSLAVSEGFECGGRICDIKAKVVPNKTDKVEDGFTIVLAMCCRDKFLRIGTFDPEAREFTPTRMFGPKEFGFPESVSFSGKSVRSCAFAPSIRKHYARTSPPQFDHNSAELFVAVHPMRATLHAAKVSIAVTSSSSCKASVVGLCSTRNGNEPPSASLTVNTKKIGDPHMKSPDCAFIVATAEGTLVEFLFEQTENEGGDEQKKKVQGVVRRLIQKGFHEDAVTCMAMSPIPAPDAESGHVHPFKLTRVCVSTDLARRVAFHTFDPQDNGEIYVGGGTTKTKTSSSNDTKDELIAPNMFTEDESTLARRRRLDMRRWIFLSVLAFIVALIAHFIMSFFF